MLIISTFEQTLELEQALGVLEKFGIHRDNILVVPMNQFRNDPKKLVVRATDIEIRTSDLGMALATAAGVIGASVGFRLKWGPIAWGLISVVVGFVVGFGVMFLLKKWKGQRAITRFPRKPIPEITMIVQCEEAKSTEVHDVLWQYKAISVGDVPEPVTR